MNFNTENWDEVRLARRPVCRAEGGSPYPELTLHLCAQRGRECLLKFCTLGTFFPASQPQLLEGQCSQGVSRKQRSSWAHRKQARESWPRIFGKMFQKPLGENETGAQREGEDPGRLRAWKSSLRMPPKD